MCLQHKTIKAAGILFIVYLLAYIAEKGDADWIRL